MKNFSQYDLITRHFKFYGYAYPFMEAFLGFAYIANAHLQTVYLITWVFMLCNGISIVTYLLAYGQKTHCACLGGAMRLPLGSISILEVLGMGTLAFYQWSCMR